MHPCIFSRRAAVLAAAAAAAAAALSVTPARAAPAVGDVFVISMENHNFVQPNGNVGSLSSIQQLKGNPNAPFQNALINGTASAVINGNPVNISAQTAYANNYTNVLATAAGTGPSIHPSEPNYIWSEAGTNFGVSNDNPPYGSGGNNQNTNFHLTGLLQAAGVPWKSYQEDIDLVPSSGTVNTPGANAVTSTVAAPSQWTVPLTNFSGTNSPSYVNGSNGSNQYDYAAKHNPMVLFTDTNGGNNNTNTNPQASKYAPLQQLATDLTNNTTARYNWITPDQNNDSHNALAAGYKPSFNPTTTLTGDSANIAQGDDFLKNIIPQIMASQAYQNNGAIIIWWDETESQATGDTPNDTNHKLEEIVISPLAKPNVGGVPYASNVLMSHSSDLRTMQELFNVGSNNAAATGGVFLNDANNANDLSDLFVSGAIPQITPTNLVPEPTSLGLLGMATVSLLARRRRNRR